MLSADLRQSVAAAARAAGHPGPWRDVGLRDGGAPGGYASSLPLRFADPPETARAMAVALRTEDWIADADPTGHGYLTITVTPEALTRTAVEAAKTGPACARSDALAGTTTAPPPTGPLPAAASWAEARELVTAQVTARLAAAAGATVAADDSAERACVHPVTTPRAQLPQGPARSRAPWSSPGRTPSATPWPVSRRNGPPLSTRSPARGTSRPIPPMLFSTRTPALHRRCAGPLPLA